MRVLDYRSARTQPRMARYRPLAAETILRFRLWSESVQQRFAGSNLIFSWQYPLTAMPARNSFQFRLKPTRARNQLYLQSLVSQFPPASIIPKLYNHRPEY